MLKTFVMTTLDSATRIARYVCGEVLGDGIGIRVFKNRFFQQVFIFVSQTGDNLIMFTDYGSVMVA